jgi:hypothetical protein
MEGGSLEPVVIKVPNDDVDVELAREEVDEEVIDTVAFSQESRVASSESVS